MIINEFNENEVLETLYKLAFSYANKNKIDDLKKVKEIFSYFQQVEFKSALEGSSQDKKDGVLILKRGGK